MESYFIGIHTHLPISIMYKKKVTSDRQCYFSVKRYSELIVLPKVLTAMYYVAKYQ